MAKSVLSHYSPVLANKYWNEDSHYACFYKDIHSNEVISKSKGKKQWGRELGLYSLEVENSLANDLESPASAVYEKLINFDTLTHTDRAKWSQFLLSQLVRTPTYMKYEKFLMDKQGVSDTPENDRVGCIDCIDNRYIAQRKWMYLLPHEDDYFMRTDNPIFQTGFLEIPKSCFYYPLHPRLCFVACSMDSQWDPMLSATSEPGDMSGIELEKGMAWQLNFYMAKSARNSLIMKHSDSTMHSESMCKQILGTYPQPPFDLVSFTDQSLDDRFDYIRQIMSDCDEVEYPVWNAEDLEPFL